MADHQFHQTVPHDTAEGSWIVDNDGEDLTFMPDQALIHDRLQYSENMSTESIAEYISNLSPSQSRLADDLRRLGWDDHGIHDFFSHLEHLKLHLSAILREKGRSEADIASLNGLCSKDIADLSHLRRPGTSRADEEYQLQLYLLHEMQRRKQIMLGDD
jgi:hypothetical protein